MKEWILRLKKRRTVRFSKPSLETLAVIAYKQPVTRAQVEQIRGVDPSGPIRFLLDKGLIRIAGRKDVPGRPLLYATTKKFMEVFQLKDLSSLPSMTEIEELEGNQRLLPLFPT